MNAARYTSSSSRSLATTTPREWAASLWAILFCVGKFL
jgi:hypothetical protein